MHRLLRSLLCFFVFAPSVVNAQAGPAADVITIAHDVASSRIHQYRYGDNLKMGQVNCVQFVGAVVERLLERPLTKDEEDAVYIRYKFDDFNDAVHSGDARTQGIQNALCNVIKTGTSVPPKDVAVGDFVQYWIQKKDGSWLGHSAIVAKIIAKENADVRVAIYGSHKSTNGIAVTDFGGQGLSPRRSHVDRASSA